MNGVLGLTRLALEEQDRAAVQDYLRKIQVSGEFLLGLVNDILDLSKVESGKLELYPEPYTAGRIYKKHHRHHRTPGPGERHYSLRCGRDQRMYPCWWISCA
jgi:K+-sensing histidine kinase KdpD